MALDVIPPEKTSEGGRHGRTTAIIGLPDRVLGELRTEYLVVGKKSIRGWHAWLAFGLVVGLATGVFLVANQTGRFSLSAAAGQAVGVEAESASLIGPVAIGSDTAASGGKYIQFGGVTTPSPTPTSTQTPTPTPTRTPPSGSTQGIWISASELTTKPVSGTAWDSMRSVANGSLGTADISNQDSTHDTKVLAAALVAARTGDQAMRDKALAGLRSAIGTETGARWLAIGRNLGSYVIAADVLGVRIDSDIGQWLAQFMTRTLQHNNSGKQITFQQSAWSSGSNASAQEGFAYTALSVYLGRSDLLDWSWTAFRRYAGDRTSSHHISSNNDSWQEIPSDPVGIQNKGSVKSGCRLDGAISNDMGRGGTNICSPGYTSYPWVGLEGAIPAALVFAQQGYPAWDVADKALYRTLDFLLYVRQKTGNTAWFDGSRANESIFLVNQAYNANFPITLPTGEGRVVGFTDWTHARSVSPSPSPTPTPTRTPTPTPTPPTTQPDYVTQGLASAPGNITGGQLVSFSATIKNQGGGSATASSQSRLRLDVGNNGSYDVTPSNLTTAALAAGATEVETWASIWTATVGTHKFEICADAGSAVAESNEGNNCTTQTFTVFSSTPTPTPTPPPGGTSGIWISAAELATKPMSGSAWTKLKSVADSTWGDNGTITLYSGGHNDDTDTLAGALVYARTGDNAYRTKVRNAINAIIGTENNVDNGCCGRTLGVVRNVQAFVFAADLIDLKTMDPALDGRFRAMLQSVRSSEIIPDQERRPNNHGTHATGARIAVDFYLNDTADLNRAIQVFRGWLGDRTQYAGFSYGDLSWQCDASKPVGINPVGCIKQGQNIDGVLPDDQRRAGGFTWPPPKENYVYEGLQGVVVATEMLRRAGYPASTWSDSAIKRAFTWLHTQANFPAEGDDTWQPWVVNKIYGTSFPAPAANTGKNMGFTDWTHAK